MQNNNFPFLNPNSPQNDANNPQEAQGIKFPQVPAWGSRPQRPNSRPSRRPNNNSKLPDDNNNFGVPKPENKPGILPQLPSSEQLSDPPKPVAIPENPTNDSSNQSGPPSVEEKPVPVISEPPKESPENGFKFPDFENLFKPPTQDINGSPSLEIPGITPIEPEVGTIAPIPDPSSGNINPPTDDFDRQCNTQALEFLKGATYKPKTKEFVKKDGTSLAKSALPKQFRIVGPRTMLTMDYIPDRVNINFEPKDRNSRDENAEGIVTGFTCG
jgi:hypothetical protein